MAVFFADVNWEFLPDWILNCQYLWISDRHRANGDPRTEIDDYDLANLTLRTNDIIKHFNLAFSVRNIFDEDAREPSPYDSTVPDGAYIPEEYPMEGRSIYGEVRLHF